MKDKFYASLAWRMLRSTYAQEHPLCEECLRRGIRIPVAIVDHILPRKTHPQLSLVAVNLESLCRPCHKRKTDTDYGKPTSAPKTGCDAQGNPLGKAGDEWRSATNAAPENLSWVEEEHKKLEELLSPKRGRGRPRKSERHGNGIRKA